MVASCDTQTSGEVVCNGPNGGLDLERYPEGLDAAVDGNANDESDIKPVDVLIPVRSGHWDLGDVRLLGVIFGISVGLAGLCH